MKDCLSSSIGGGELTKACLKYAVDKVFQTNYMPININDCKFCKNQDTISKLDFFIAVTKIIQFFFSVNVTFQTCSET